MSISIVGRGGSVHSHVRNWDKALLAEKGLCIALRFAQAKTLDVSVASLSALDT